jgi:hypothetical protein
VGYEARRLFSVKKPIVLHGRWEEENSYGFQQWVVVDFDYW